MTTQRRGFTFAELLVVLALIGLLAGIGIPRYHSLKTRAYTAALRTDLGTLRVAQEAYYAEHQRYATDVGVLDFKASSDVAVTISSSDPMAVCTATSRHALGTDVCTTATGHDLGDAENGAVHCEADVPTGIATPEPAHTN